MLSGVDRDSALQPTAFDVCGCVHVCACQVDACKVMKCLWMSVWECYASVGSVFWGVSECVKGRVCKVWFMSQSVGEFCVLECQENFNRIWLSVWEVCWKILSDMDWNVVSQILILILLKYDRMEKIDLITSAVGTLSTHILHIK